jgi:uncharacterized membrane protein
MENVALFLHLLGAFVLVAGMVLAGAAFETARRREQSAEIALLLGLARIAAGLVVIGALVVPIFGLWLVHLGHWGYGTGWVDAAIALYVVVLALGALGGRAPRQARLLASRLAVDGAPPTAELRALLDDGRSRAANYSALALVVVIIVLMVFK